jgi:hypothetical protein
VIDLTVYELRQNPPGLYVLGIALSFWQQWVPHALYLLVAPRWFIPDRRIDRVLLKA